MRRATARSQQSGFTLIELLIVTSIIAILISLLLPAIQQSRERARSVQCQNNMMQLGIALHSYQDTHRVLPPGSVDHSGPILPDEKGYRMGWIAQILPYIDQGPLWSRINQGRPDFSFLSQSEIADALYMEAHPDAVAEMAGGLPLSGAPESMAMGESQDEESGVQPHLPVELSVLTCPSNPYGRSNTGIAGLSLYAGIHAGSDVPIDSDNDGLLYLNSSESLYDIPDGSTQTMLLGEHTGPPAGDGWLFGDRGTLRTGGLPLLRRGSKLALEMGQVFPSFNMYNVQLQGEQISADILEKWRLRSGPLGSYHVSVNVVFADGSLKRLSYGLNPEVLSKLCRRNDGAFISASEY